MTRKPLWAEKRELKTSLAFQDSGAILSDKEVDAEVSHGPQGKPILMKAWHGADARRVYKRAFLLLSRREYIRKEKKWFNGQTFQFWATVVANYYVWLSTPRSERPKNWPTYLGFCASVPIEPGRLKQLLGVVRWELWKGRYVADTDQDRLRELKDVAHAKAMEIEQLPVADLTGGAAQLLRTAMEQHGGANGKSVSVNIDNRKQSLTVVSDKEMKELFLAAVEENKRLLRDVDYEEVPDGRESPREAQGRAESEV